MRIGLKQILLLMALVGLIAGLFAILAHQKPATTYYSADVSPDGKHLVALGYRGWDLFDLERRRRVAARRWPALEYSFGAVESPGVEFIDNESFLYASSANPFDQHVEIKRIEISDLSEQDVVSMNALWSTPVAIVNGKTIVRSQDLPPTANTPNNPDDSLTVIEPDGTRRKIDVHGEPGSRFLLSPDLKWFVSMPDPFAMTVSNLDTTIENLETGERWTLAPQETVDVTFSPDGKRMAVWWESQLRLYELAEESFPVPTDASDAPRLSQRSPAPSSNVQTNVAKDQDESESGQVAANEAESVDSAGETSVSEEQRTAETSGKNVGPWQLTWSRSDRIDNVDVDWQSNRIALLDRYRDRVVRIIDARTGDATTSVNSYFGAQLTVFIPDTNHLAIIPSSSDSPVQVRDLSSDTVVYRMGGESRFGMSVAYAGLFIVWALVWGFVTRRNRIAWMEDRTATSADPFEPVIDAELVSPAVSNTVDSRSPAGLQAAWIMMAVGGLFAIGWAVIPMFFMKNGVAANFAPALLYLRYGMATYSLGVGLCALSAASGQSQSRRWLTTVAILQLTNIVVLDVLNLGLAIAELVMLAQPESRQVLDRDG